MCFAVGAVIGTALADRSDGAPPVVYSGVILVGGAPISDASHDVGLSLWSTASGATGGLCDMPSAPVTTSGGRFAVTLSENCENVFETEAAVYVELTVDGTRLSRTRAGAVPYAISAEHAISLGAPRRIMASSTSHNGRITDGALVGYAAARAIYQREMGSNTAHLCYASGLCKRV